MTLHLEFLQTPCYYVWSKEYAFPLSSNAEALLNARSSCQKASAQVHPAILRLTTAIRKLPTRNDPEFEGCRDGHGRSAISHIDTIRSFYVMQIIAAKLFICFYILARRVFLSISLRAKPQVKSPYGPIKLPTSFAFSLLAWRCAYLAAIPCMMTLFRKLANVSPHSNSGPGSQPATSAYHCAHCAREGSPGVDADGLKASLVRGVMARLGGSTAKL